MRMLSSVTPLLILASLILAAASQPPNEPPMKMGLWEIRSTMSFVSEDAPGGRGGGTTTARTCMTPGSYKPTLGSGRDQEDCTRSNEVSTAKGYSFDMSCRNGTEKGHFEVVFDSPESYHSTMRMTVSVEQHPMSMVTTINSRFLGAECGAVAPGKPVIVR
jgi:hypothetical protein